MYNQTFYNNFPGNNFPFHNNPPSFVPPPPPPPAFFASPLPMRNPGFSDQEFVKKFENALAIENKRKTQILSINEVKEKLRTLILTLNDIKNIEKLLTENLSTLSAAEWSATMTEIEKNKAQITGIMAQINDTYLEALRKLLAKRSAKRLRLKRVRLERKREKADRIKELEERSRKIDENLQKIKDDIEKAKQEEEAKLQADIVLKEVLRKKHDAKKCIVKLDALIKLRKARQNTAQGRGENVSERDAMTFNSNIEKLKSLWVQKLTIYEKEETDLRAKLKQENESQNTVSSDKETKVLDGLKKWRGFLFGGNTSPQVDFQGDIGRFVATRSQWDRFISEEGSPLPVGWILPHL